MNVARYLIAGGAPLEIDDRLTPLHIACERGNLELITYLVEHGADINAKTDPTKDILLSGYRYNDGTTPLHIACKSGRLEIIKYLAEHGAEINIINEHDETPLSIAQNDNHVEITEYLIAHGAK